MYLRIPQHTTIQNSCNIFNRSMMFHHCITKHNLSQEMFGVQRGRSPKQILSTPVWKMFDSLYNDLSFQQFQQRQLFQGGRQFIKRLAPGFTIRRVIIVNSPSPNEFVNAFVSVTASAKYWFFNQHTDTYGVPFLYFCTLHTYRVVTQSGPRVSRE